MIKKHNKQLFLIMGFILIIGCASTRLTSFMDPSYKGKSFHKILVVALFSEMDYRENAEAAFVKYLKIHSVEGVPSMQIIMPTRTYNDEELVKILADNKIDSVLIINLTDAYSKQVYIPETHQTHGSATLSGNTINFSATTYSSGGHYVSKPRVRFQINLYDVTTGKVAWTASSLTKGNAFARFGHLVSSLADTTIQKLKTDGLLP